jgi:hypothetical protein
LQVSGACRCLRVRFQIELTHTNYLAKHERPGQTPLHPPSLRASAQLVPSCPSHHSTQATRLHPPSPPPNAPAPRPWACWPPCSFSSLRQLPSWCSWQLPSGWACCPAKRGISWVRWKAVHWFMFVTAWATVYTQAKQCTPCAHLCCGCRVLQVWAHSVADAWWSAGQAGQSAQSPLIVMCQLPRAAPGSMIHKCALCADVLQC